MTETQAEIVIKTIEYFKDYLNQFRGKNELEHWAVYASRIEEMDVLAHKLEMSLERLKK